MNKEAAVLQAAVDWNIKQRDVAKQLHRTKDARRHQRNIDELNAKLRAYSDKAN
jgi:hypothetical protein